MPSIVAQVNSRVWLDFPLNYSEYAKQDYLVFNVLITCSFLLLYRGQAGAKKGKIMLC